MLITEGICQGKTALESQNEDGLAIGSLIVVIDGATSNDLQKPTPGYLAKEAIKSLVQSQLDFDDAQTFFEACDKSVQGTGGRASVIAYSPKHQEVWNYGDCQFLLDGCLFSYPKKIDRINSDLRAAYLIQALEQGSTVDELRQQDLGRQAILPHLQMQKSFENRSGEFGFPVINGSGIRPELITITSTADAKELVLATDGYPQLFPTFEETEDYLQQALVEDPLCIFKLRGTKAIGLANQSYDDRTYCKILL